MPTTETVNIFTAPFGDECINIHQEAQKLMRLTEARLVAVKRNHNRTLSLITSTNGSFLLTRCDYLERFVAEAAISSRDKSVVNVHVKNWVVEFALFLTFGQHVASKHGILCGLLK